ncbi:hypothetical protein [Wenzhouxiangella marina]|uniref:hypothetical protein n=1 Tax=Wenzhouxiangella marina TaxID=1579979 RepID=UPI0006737C2C|nr:hypothetical protein [Wenzhouxiangella marina]MBB6087751.1 hypothetical protein [Wenzhouxiangella marina]
MTVTLQDGANDPVEDVVCDLANQASLTISPETGNINLTVADLASCLGTADALNVSQVFLIPQSSTTAGDQIRVIWASVGPDGYTCAPSASSTLPGWSNVSFAQTQGPFDYTVPAATAQGNYTVGVSCSDGQEIVAGQAASIFVNEQDPGDPPTINSLTVNGSSSATSIQPGDTLAVAWTTSNAQTCQGSGDFPNWAGTKAVSGNQQITTLSTLGEGSYTVRLQCTNDAGSSQLVTRTVSVNAAAPTECSGRALLGQGTLSNWARKTTGSNSCLWSNPPENQLVQTADCRNFGDVWPAVWPGGGNVSRNLFVAGTRPEFIAMQFNSGNIPAGQSGSIGLESPQFAGATAAFKMWSISRCPGDFNKDLIDAEMGPGCIRRDSFTFLESFDWGGEAFRTSTSRCALEPNTTYYLNLIWTQDVAGTPPQDITQHPACAEFGRCGTNALMSGTYTP